MVQTMADLLMQKRVADIIIEAKEDWHRVIGAIDRAKYVQSLILFNFESINVHTSI